jgi:hypothetical protein
MILTTHENKLFTHLYIFSCAVHHTHSFTYFSYAVHHTHVYHHISLTHAVAPHRKSSDINEKATSSDFSAREAAARFDRLQQGTLKARLF